MRVALLSYRSKQHVGGQGVYVRHLSRELVALGHDVEVFSGQPYPVLDPGVRLTEVPEPRPLPRAGPVPPAAARARSATASTCWSWRRCGPPASRSRAPSASGWRGCCATGSAEFDVVHDNQTLGRRAARHRARRAAAGDHHPPPDHLRPAGGPRGGDLVAVAGWPCAGGTASCACRAGWRAGAGTSCAPRRARPATSSPTSAWTPRASRSSRSVSTRCSRRRPCPGSPAASSRWRARTCR